LRGQILDLVEQAQNRAFHTYRTMVESTSSANPSSDSGYVSSPSRTSLSREGDTSNLTANSSTLSTTEPGHEIRSSEARPAEVSPPERDMDIAHMNPSELHPQTEETASSDLLWIDGDNISSLPVFISQPFSPDPNFDLNSFTSEFSLEADERGYGQDFWFSNNHLNS